MTTLTKTSSGGVRALYSGNATAVVGRGLLATRSTNWMIVLTGVFEPIFYLLALGLGLGSYIGVVTDGQGNDIPYAAFIAPALLAVSAMNGAIYDSTWNVFFKMHFGKLYQGMLATSLGPLDVALGEISLALLRGAAYGLTFLLVKFGFEYMPKWSGYFFSFDPALSKYTANIVPEQAKLGGLIQFVEGYGGKRPGKMFDYPFASSPQMPIWWAVYYSGTVIHASHVVIGMALIARAWWRARKGHYGPGHYTFVEITGLYWHLVDLVWIFLFPLLYLIH